MKNNNSINICGALVAALSLQPLNVWAEGAHHGPTLTILWINFIIFAVAMFFLVRKPVVASWRKRVADLEDNILRSERELAKAEERLNSVQAKISSVGEELSKIHANIAEEARYESNKIQEQAKEQKLRILKQAKLSVESEIKAVEKSVKAEFANKVCDLAKDRLKKEFSSDNDRHYRAASLQGLNTLIKSK